MSRQKILTDKNIIAIPISEDDKLKISEQADILQLPVATYCRLVLLKNLKKNSIEDLLPDVTN